MTYELLFGGGHLRFHGLKPLSSGTPGQTPPHPANCMSVTDLEDIVAAAVLSGAGRHQGSSHVQTGAGPPEEAVVSGEHD